MFKMDLHERINASITKLKNNLLVLRAQAKGKNTLELIGLNETYIALFEEVVANDGVQNPKFLLLLNHIVYALDEKK